MLLGLAVGDISGSSASEAVALHLHGEMRLNYRLYFIEIYPITKNKSRGTRENMDHKFLSNCNS